MRIHVRIFAAATFIVACGGTELSRDSNPVTTSARFYRPRVVSVGEVTSHSAVVWAYGLHGEWMHVTWQDETSRRVAVAPVESARTARMSLSRLQAASPYTVAVAFSDDPHPRFSRASYLARFRTAPEPNDSRGIRFAWSGDLAGQNVCRDKKRGFPALKQLAKEPLHFWIGLGDMIYADGHCASVGKWGNSQVPRKVHAARTREDFARHWTYNRNDDGMRALLARTAYYAVPDDHETVNDVGPKHDAPRADPNQHLLAPAMRAFYDHNPLTASGTLPLPLHRSVRWGKHLELFFLDTRQHRDANQARDLDSQPKTMLGSKQKEWLLQALEHSNATWLVVVSSVSIGHPAGTNAARFGRDGWASHETDTGFERELNSILSHVSPTGGTGRKQLIWLSGDVHFASHVRFRKWSEQGLIVDEFTAGPLSAGIGRVSTVDESFAPELLFAHSAAGENSVKTYQESLHWMNYGVVQVSKSGDLSVQFKNALGEQLYEWRSKPTTSFGAETHH